MPISQALSAELGRRLRQSRADVLAAVRARTGGDDPAIAPGSHIGQNEDRPQAEMISHDEEHFAEHETALLHDIDAALGRLASGAAGICVACGREIPEDRLLAAPTVQTCIGCQSRIEQEQRSGRGPTI